MTFQQCVKKFSLKHIPKLSADMSEGSHSQFFRTITGYHQDQVQYSVVRLSKPSCEFKILHSLTPLY